MALIRSSPCKVNLLLNILGADRTGSTTWKPCSTRYRYATS